MRRLLSYEENDPVAFSCILFTLADGVVISCDAIWLRKVGHRYLAEVPHSCGSTQDVVGKEMVVRSTPEGIWPGPQTSAGARPSGCLLNRFLWGGRPLDQLDAGAPRIGDVCERDASRLVLADWLIELDALRFDLLDERL
jgi:hypothetical protein